jgi:uncharacterized protein with HEPN domain
LPSKNTILRLEDILENIGLIEQYTRDYSHQSFVQDRKTQDAVERCLLRISEAAKKLEGSVDTIVPDQPWSAIRAVGNVLRHEYDRVDPEIIWRIVNNDLDPLKRAVEVGTQQALTLAAKRFLKFHPRVREETLNACL